jgi:hypothetical protein
MMALAWGGSEGMLDWQGSIVHNPVVALDRVSVMMVTPSEVMDIACLVKVVVQPYSYSWPIDSSEIDSRFGKMCVSVASFGMP